MVEFTGKLAEARSEYEKFEQLLGSEGKNAGAWVDPFFDANLSVWLILRKEANESKIRNAELLQILYIRLLLERVLNLPALNEDEWGAVMIALDIYSSEVVRKLFRTRNDLEINYNILLDQYPSSAYISLLDRLSRALEKRKNFLA